MTAGSSSQSISAASPRSRTCGPPVFEKRSQPQSMNASILSRVPVISDGVHAEPGHVRELPVDLVMVLADLGDRRAAPDHRHDALVLVVEVLARLAVEVGEDVVRRPLRRSAAPPSRAAEASDRPGRGCWRRRRSRRPRRLPASVRSALDVDAPAPADREAAVGGDRGRRDAAAPDHAPRGDDGAVREQRMAGPDLLDAGAEVQLDLALLQHLRDVAVRLVRERAQQRVAEVEQVDASRTWRRGCGTRRARSRRSCRRARRRPRRRSDRRRRSRS